MCNVLRQFCREVLSLTKTWTIRRQMLVSYLIGFSFVVISFVFTVIVNFYILKKQTVQQMEEALVDQARDNMSALVQQGSNYVTTLLSDVTIMFQFLTVYFNNMEPERTFSLEYMSQYTYPESKVACEYTNPQGNYGAHGACFDFSVFYMLGTPLGDETFKKASRYEVLWKNIHQQSTPLVLRYYVYFEKSHFFMVYPGTYIPPPFLPPWMSEYQQNRTLFSTPIYSDHLGNPKNKIITIAAPFLDSSGADLGVLSADLLVSELYTNLDELNYMNKSGVFLVDRSGELLKKDVKPGDLENFLNIKDLVGTHTWDDMVTDPHKTYFFIKNEDLYRISLAPITARVRGYESEPWFYLLISIKESEILKYQHKAGEYIEILELRLFGGVLGLIVVTILASVVLIHCLARRIEQPLIGIIKFMNNLNAITNDHDERILGELYSLSKGEDVIEELVTTFQSLATNLNNQQDDRTPTSFASSTQNKFPVNELYGRPVPWEWLYGTYVRSVKIVDFSTSSTDGFTTYLLEIQGVTRFMHPLALPFDKPAPVFRKLSRYSAISDLHKELIKLYSESALPIFPPKKSFGNTKKEFVAMRVAQLNAYFQQCLAIPELQSSEPMLKFIAPDNVNRVGIIGPRGIGKKAMVQLLLTRTLMTSLIQEKEVRGSMANHLIAELPVDILVGYTLHRITQLYIHDIEDGIPTKSLHTKFDAILFCAATTENEELSAVYELTREKIPSLYLEMSQNFFCQESVYAIFQGLCQTLPSECL